MKAPVVIGALGGSGTRVVAEIVREAGYFLGENRNQAHDAVEFFEFYDRWVNRFLFCDEVPFSCEEQKLMDHDWDVCVARHRQEIPSGDSSWGWKNPRSILLLPFFHEKYPDMKFIHVLRDGRDMAFSQNHQQLRKHGAAILRHGLSEAPQAVRTAALWAKINLDAAAFGRRRLGRNYLLIKYETLCFKPNESVGEILNFLRGDASDVEKIAAKLIRFPATSGRWRQAKEKETLARIQIEAGTALREFGYCDS